MGCSGCSMPPEPSQAARRAVLTPRKWVSSLLMSSFSSDFFSLCLSPSFPEYWWKTSMMAIIAFSSSDMVVACPEVRGNVGTPAWASSSNSYCFGSTATPGLRPCIRKVGPALKAFCWEALAAALASGGRSRETITLLPGALEDSRATRRGEGQAWGQLRSFRKVLLSLLSQVPSPMSLPADLSPAQQSGEPGRNQF